MVASRAEHRQLGLQEGDVAGEPYQDFTCAGQVSLASQYLQLEDGGVDGGHLEKRDHALESVRCLGESGRVVPGEGLPRLGQ
jgi:hypothetical protein